MSKKADMELTRGSEYKIISIGGRDHMLESKGIFEGYASVGMDEIGLLMKLKETHDNMNGKIRIVPLHAILAIDVLDAKPDDNQDDDQEMPRYVG